MAVHHRAQLLVKGKAPENKSSPVVVTEQWLLKNYKSARKLRLKPWKNPKIKKKNKKKGPERRLSRPHTQQTRHNTPVLDPYQLLRHLHLAVRVSSIQSR